MDNSREDVAMEAPPEPPRKWLFVLIIGVLVVLTVGAAVAIRPELLAGLQGTSGQSSSLTSEERSWCATNRDRVFRAVVETEEIGPLVDPREAELWEFWTTDE